MLYLVGFYILLNLNRDYFLAEVIMKKLIQFLMVLIIAFLFACDVNAAECQDFFSDVTSPTTLDWGSPIRTQLNQMPYPEEIDESDQPELPNQIPVLEEPCECDQPEPPGAKNGDAFCSLNIEEVVTDEERIRNVEMFLNCQHIIFENEEADFSEKIFSPYICFSKEEKESILSDDLCVGCISHFLQDDSDGITAKLVIRTDKTVLELLTNCLKHCGLLGFYKSVIFCAFKTLYDLKLKELGDVVACKSYALDIINIAIVLGFQSIANTIEDVALLDKYGHN
jgi:hypothetical protein